MSDYASYIDDTGAVFNGSFTSEGARGPIGPRGEPGYTPTRGVDYWTAEDQQTVITEATSLINGKIEEYNDNATAKTGEFNTNATNKTNTFNNNATDKTSAFNTNASDKTDAFNNNATSKTTDFNDNASSKTTTFNSHVSDKTTAFDEHVTSKTTDFDAHVASEFNELTGSFYTKAETYTKDEINSKLASTYHYKGSVTDYTYLPSSGQQVGDVWNIEIAGGGYDAGDNVAWTGTDWDKLAGTVDLSNYYTKSQVDNIANTKQATINNDNKLNADYVSDSGTTNKFVTSAEKTTWNNKSDFSGSYNDLTNKPDLTVYEEKSNKTNELSGNSTQTQYPNAEIVYKWLDSITPKETVSGEAINVQDSSDLPIKDFAMLGNATQDTSILTYKCIGTESGDYYFVYDSTNYQFTMPTISANDLLTFNTSTKKLYKGTTEITTTTASTGTLITLSATPNSDYPQDIYVVTGDNTLKVVGKNLFNPALLSQQENYNTYDNNTGLWTTNSGGGFSRSILYNVTGATHNVDITKVVKVQPNATYTLKFYDVVNSSNNTIKILYADSTGTIISALASQPMPTITFTTPANCRYIDIARQESSGTFSFSKIQLEVGSTATAYKPYIAPQTQLLSLGDIELCRIPDTNIYDLIYKSSGKWYVEKNIDKVTFNGGENWSYNGTVLGYAGFVVKISNAKEVTNSDDNIRVCCDKLISRTSADILSSSIAFSGALISNKRFYLQTITNFGTDANYLKTWLSSNNIKVYYVLATPTTTEITDETLLAQLENVLKMHTNKNVTNAWIEPTGTNANGGLQIEYRQDIETLTTNNTNAILSIGGNV